MPVCRANSIKKSNVNKEERMIFNKPVTVIICQRKSIRSYTAKPIEEEKIMR
jgi:hypothetical protein